MKERNQIIIALDNNIENGLELVKMIEDDPDLMRKVYGYKIGSIWMLDRGLDILDDVCSKLNIILDMQKWPTDTPEVVTKQVNKIVKKECVDELIASPMGGGRKSLEAFVTKCKDNDIRPLCVLEMTHPESDSYLKLGAWLDILHDAATLGVDGYVIPATKQPREEIKMHLRTDFPNISYDLYTTGYKVQGGQAEPMIKFGVSKFIVGRAIYDAEDVVQTIDRSYREINGIQDTLEEQLEK